MTNFPSKWFDFVNHKELKRLRSDVNNTFWLKMQIIISLIIAILTIIFDANVNELDNLRKIILAVCLCFIIIFVFSAPYIVEKIKIRLRNNVIIHGKKATSLFDEDIVYDVLVASEFYGIYTKTEDSPISNHLKQFYEIEIIYYLRTAINNLRMFNSSLPLVLGEQPNQISLHRLENLCNLIDTIIKEMAINMDIGLMKGYNDLKAIIKSKSKDEEKI